MKQSRDDIRNIAIIAHVDHGKTTLVDELLKQSGVFRANQEVAERVMDSNDIERERGITILSKNTAVYYKDTKINIIDTPGHADFGGEVERVLKMVDGVVLVVDAFEGAMPQTKFVLMKALDLDLPVIVCINKIDRPEARPDEVIDEVLELFMDLDASDEQLDCPFVYASAKEGFAVLNLDDERKDMVPLFETILDYIPAPTGDPDLGTQVLISTIDYNEYVGRIGIGKVDNGSLRINQEVAVVNHHEPDKLKKVRINKLYEFDGLEKVDVEEARIGSIVAVSGIADIHIGDTICNPDALRIYSIRAGIAFGSFLAMWSCLAFKMGQAPFYADSDVIGILGLCGIAGASTASLVGKYVKKVGILNFNFIGCGLILLAWASLYFCGNTYAGIIAGVLLIDIGMQCIQLSNQTSIFDICPSASNRVNTIFMTTYFTGGSLGTFLAGSCWQTWGWAGVAGIGTVLTLLSLLITICHKEQQHALFP